MSNNRRFQSLLISCLVCLVCVGSAFGAQLFAVVSVSSGAPEIDAQTTPYRGYVHCGGNANWGAYLISGTGAQLVAINALPNVYGICAVTKSGNVIWAELDNTIPAGVRTRLNTWLTARGFATIPAGWTNRQVVRAIFQRLRVDFEIGQEDVADD